MTGHLDDALWQTVQASVPIVCVDVVPIRDGEDGLEVGLIERTFPGDGSRVWCHLGGRVQHGETVAEALTRHVTETVEGARLELPADPQPDHVMQWFPSALRTDSTFGDDPRKHAVSLCFALRLGDHLVARSGGEGLDLRWFPAGLEGVEPLWPGTAHLVASTVPSTSSGT